MKVWGFSFGIIFLLTGLFLMLFSGYSQHETINHVVAYAGRDKAPSWELAGYFEKGDNIVVDFRPSSDWAQEPYEVSDDYPRVPIKLVYFNVSSPNGGGTLFGVILGKYPNKPWLLKLKIEVVEDMSSDGLVVSDYLEKIEGIAKYDGTYKVTVIGPLPPGTERNSPPSYLSLAKNYEVTTYPLKYLFPVGTLVTISGIALTVWSVKSSKRRVLRHKTRTLHLKKS